MPSVLAKPLDQSFLTDLKDSVAQLCSLYEATLQFELESRTACPTEKFETVNEMTYGWSNPIRDGIHEFLTVLKQIAEINPKTIKQSDAPPPTFSIKLNTPPNISLFSKELKHAMEK